MGDYHSKNPGMRAAGVLLLLVMLFELGCAGRKTLLKMEPPPKENPGVELPADVEVSLKEKTALKARFRNKKAVWKGKQMSGEITGWRDGVIVLNKKPSSAGSPYKWNFSVPVEKIERIGFLGPSGKSGGLWLGVSLGVFSVLASLLAYGFLLSQGGIGPI
jgi:hypothetical protein